METTLNLAEKVESWNNLDPRVRKLVLVLGGLDATLRTAALADLRKRSADEIRGPKPLWMAGLMLVNSMGALPLAYWLVGRDRD